MRRLCPWTVGVYVALGLAIGIVVLLARAHRELETRYQRLAERSAWLHPGSYVPPIPTVSLAGDTLAIGAPPAGVRQVLLVFSRQQSDGQFLQLQPAAGTRDLRVRNAV